MLVSPPLGDFSLLVLDLPSVASTVGKAAIVVLVMFSYPLQVHPCRASVDAVMKWRPMKRNQHSPNVSPARLAPLLPPSSHGSARTEPMGDTRFAAITTAIIVLSYVVAMTVSSLDQVLAYVGSTGSTSISFILPGLFYHKISAPDSIHHQRLAKEDDDQYEPVGQADGERDSRKRQWLESLLRPLSLALAIYGFVVMAVCLTMNIFLNASAH